MVGIEVVIRDYQGLVIASCTKKLPQAYNGVDVKAMAAAMTLLLATNIGISRVVLKGNSWVVIKATYMELMFLLLLLLDCWLKTWRFCLEILINYFILVNVYYVVGFKPARLLVYHTFLYYILTCIAHIFTCTVHICLLYKGTHVYSLIMKYNTTDFSISNMVSEPLL